MNRNEVIKYPILSEKTYKKMEDNIFTFAVDFRTNKVEVKKVVEFIFGVKVAKVNIANVAKKPTKLGKFHGFTNRYKRAVITLSEGSINLFPEEVASTPKAEVKPATIKNDEPTEAEKKAAAKIAAKLKEKESGVKKPESKSTKTEVKKEEKPVKAEK